MICKGSLTKAPAMVYIAATSQSEGNLNLSDGTNWNVDKAHISLIQIETDSTDYDVVLYPDDDFDTSGAFPPITLGEGLSGDNALFVELDYYDTDESGEVHLKYTDNSGSNTADIYIRGTEIQ